MNIFFEISKTGVCTEKNVLSIDSSSKKGEKERPKEHKTTTTKESSNKHTPSPHDWRQNVKVALLGTIFFAEGTTLQREKDVITTHHL